MNKFAVLNFYPDIEIKVREYFPVFKMIFIAFIGILSVVVFAKYFWILVWVGFWITTIITFKTVLTTNLDDYRYGSWIPKKI